jgi:hypothetical protein
VRRCPDGQPFHTSRTPKPPPAPVVTHINLVLNWFEELKAKVPTSSYSSAQSDPRSSSISTKGSAQTTAEPK